ncbi:hypothetical protein [Glutamicibacter ardleyensis]
MDVATAMALSQVHVVIGIGWFFAVPYGNKNFHVASKGIVFA